MPRLTRKACTGDLMPTSPPGAATKWWTVRLLAAETEGKTTITRPPNSRRLVEMLASAEVRRQLGKYPGVQIVDAQPETTTPRNGGATKP